jgi:hypothetical protein
VDITEIAINYFDFIANQFQHSHNREVLYFAQDQDAFNIAAIIKCEISEMGPNRRYGFIQRLCQYYRWAKIAKQFILSALELRLL